MHESLEERRRLVGAKFPIAAHFGGVCDMGHIGAVSAVGLSGVGYKVDVY